MNQYFVDSIRSLNNEIPQVNFVNYLEQSLSRFQFEYVNDQTLKKICKSMNKKKDFDGISTQIVLDNWDLVGANLVEIINKSLHDGSCPSTWKESIIIPVPKVKNTIKCEEFRPINTLSIFEKILEKVVYLQLENYCEEKRILMKEQSGFRKKHSCETTVNFIINEWKEDIDENKFVVAIFLDFRRAFETIDRQILLEKLRKYGIVGKELDWFESYLSGRTQRTRVNSCLSESEDTTLGVPQGSVLGTLLFLLYINDMKEATRFTRISLFADDTLMYSSGRNSQLAKQQINQDLDILSEWLQMNKLMLNVKKTKCMTLNLNCDISLEINGELIDGVEEMKYLGIVLDKKLNFNSHVDYICKKIGKKLGFFKRIRRRMSTMTSIHVYNSIVRPHFEYCSTVLFLCSQTAMERLQKLQNKAMRCILKCNRFTSIRWMLDTLKWMCCKERIVFNVLLFIFNMKTGRHPEYLEEKLNLVADVQPYNLRGAEVTYRLSRSRRRSTQNSLLYKGLQMFNELPPELRSETGFHRFKKGCVQFIRSSTLS